MLHSLKANLVNLQDENKPTLHADCYISTSPVEGVSYIPDAWAVACFSPKVLPEPAFIRQVDGPRFFYNRRYMGYSEFILTINATSVIILLVMVFIQCSAARLKGECCFAALIIVLTTIPVYTYNICRIVGWYDLALILAPPAYSVNLTQMPLLWMLAHKGFNPLYRIDAVKLLHFFPAFQLLVLFCACLYALPTEKLYSFVIYDEWGKENWLIDANYLIFSVQAAGYLYVIFRYLRRVKHFVQNYYSEAELQYKVWIPRFITLLVSKSVIEMMCYVVCPHTEVCIFQLLTVVIMAYLFYSELKISYLLRNLAQPSPVVIAEAKEEFIAMEVNRTPLSDADNQKEDIDKLQQCAQQVEEYLRSSEAYMNPNLSIKEVAYATGISSKNLSKAINQVLGRNFFDIVNGYRVEKAKVLLLAKKKKGLTLDTIAEQCGFNSRFTLNAAFKRTVGATTSDWLKLNQDEK